MIAPTARPAFGGAVSILTPVLSDAPATLRHLANALSQVSRPPFNGWCTAQRSVLLSRIVPQRLRLPAMLAHCADAYLGYTPPATRAAVLQLAFRSGGSDPFDALAAPFLIIVSRRFGLDWPLSLDDQRIMAEAQGAALATEFRDLYHGEPPSDLGPPSTLKLTPAVHPAVAAEAFELRFRQLQEIEATRAREAARARGAA
ncbi:hypothetical protein [Nitrospirillum viridazoti]|uniref:Uncharacterized protein n=1 Tax=Nitrospirillum viridazoti CBAmc TaxID=1441467 RepID=A0A248JRL4_9PROT|nr:hypothetical protein [Nitrospirillum amazonense]ASG21382.1 hypothetical protein Y958_11505 [Nitrospirillum amazonense CBAmc]TWB33059.1 hypothetical protein FBZ91_115121 [Nitrospirillum amazonense]